ncbi:sterol desaturase family protein [Piscinibacter aquaticus]|uniref:Sterol desaturase family protein n=1 Tax=Piscinibacter aquaticus TaxID=392597 RepID=A0A5C6TY00_9BURK|nr:sterol desaturase family protein [Piscinibacter aquaticus]
MNDVIVSLTTKLQNLFRGVEQSMLVTAGLLLSLLLIECALVGWSKSSLRALLSKSMSAWVDIACAALVLSNVALLLGTVMTFGVVYALTAQIKAHISIGVLDYAGSPYVCYAVYIVALDFTNYWVHRWMHTDRRLWEIHRFHHEARDFTMLTTLRDHPMERVLLHSAGAIPSALLGMPPSHYLAAQLLLQSVGFLKHSNLDSDWGWLGRWVVQSPPRPSPASQHGGGTP